MTIEEILGFPPHTLESITDEQYLKWFEEQGYLNVTRPELAPKPVNGVRVVQQPQMTFKAKQNLAKLAELGIDVSDVMKKKGRR